MPLPLDTSAPRTHYDIAYACFLLNWLAVVFGGASFFIYIGHFNVPLPLSLLAWVASLVGVGFSIRLWRHAPLSILGALTVLFVLLGFFVGLMDPKQQERWFGFMDAVHWAYGITVTVIALWWFLRFRQRAAAAMAKANRETLYHDAAYGAFFFLGLQALWIAYWFPWGGPSEYIAFAFLGLMGVPGILIAITFILFARFAFKSKDTLLLVLWLLAFVFLPAGLLFHAVGILGAVVLTIYGALAVIFSTWWFAFARRKKKPQT